MNIWIVRSYTLLTWLMGLSGITLIWIPTPSLLKAHILIGPMLIFVLGSLTIDHAFPLRSNSGVAGRKSGWGIVLLLVGMILSGYLMQVFSTPRLIEVTKWVHVTFGTLFWIFAIVHSRAVRS